MITFVRYASCDVSFHFDFIDMALLYMFHFKDTFPCAGEIDKHHHVDDTNLDTSPKWKSALNSL